VRRIVPPRRRRARRNPPAGGTDRFTGKQFGASIDLEPLAVMLVEVAR